MIDGSILSAIHARLASALSPAAGRYRPLRVERDIVGWLDDERADRIAAFGDVFVVTDEAITFARGIDDPAARSQAIDRVCRDLAAQGLLTAWRNERYAVAVSFGASPLFVLERSAARFFGIHTYAAHVNGVVADRASRIDDVTMWLARRSRTKSIDPGLLDNLVGGGVAADATVRETVSKEAWEEAGIAQSLAATAVPAGVVHICRSQTDGLHRETIFAHDLALPSDFTPAAQDDEVMEHRRVSLREAANVITNAHGNDVMTVDASLVVLDYLLRHGAIAPDDAHYIELEGLRHPPMTPNAARA